MKRGKNRKFGREKNQRAMLYKSLATALIDHGKITTTVTKAKSLSSFISKLITIAKKQNMASHRILLSSIGSKAASKLIKEVAPKLADKKGGYTRIIKLGQRKSDAAPMAIIEFTAETNIKQEEKPVKK